MLLQLAKVGDQQIVRLPAGVVEEHARVLYGEPELLWQRLQPVLCGIDGGEGQKVASYVIGQLWVILTFLGIRISRRFNLSIFVKNHSKIVQGDSGGRRPGLG